MTKPSREVIHLMMRAGYLGGHHALPGVVVAGAVIGVYLTITNRRFVVQAEGAGQPGTVLLSVPLADVAGMSVVGGQPFGATSSLTFDLHTGERVAFEADAPGPLLEASLTPVRDLLGPEGPA